MKFRLEKSRAEAFELAKLKSDEEMVPAVSDS